VHNVSQWPNLRHLGESLGAVSETFHAVTTNLESSSGSWSRSSM